MRHNLFTNGSTCRRETCFRLRPKVSSTLFTSSSDNYFEIFLSGAGGDRKREIRSRNETERCLGFHFNGTNRNGSLKTTRCWWSVSRYLCSSIGSAASLAEENKRAEQIYVLGPRFDARTFKMRFSLFVRRNECEQDGVPCVPPHRAQLERRCAAPRSFALALHHRIMMINRTILHHRDSL